MIWQSARWTDRICDFPLGIVPDERGCDHDSERLDGVTQHVNECRLDVEILLLRMVDVAVGGRSVRVAVSVVVVVLVAARMRALVVQTLVLGRVTRAAVQMAVRAVTAVRVTVVAAVSEGGALFAFLRLRLAAVRVRVAVVATKPVRMAMASLNRSCTHASSAATSCVSRMARSVRALSCDTAMTVASLSRSVDR